MNRPAPSRTPQTEKLLAWLAFMSCGIVLVFTWSTYDEEVSRLAGLRASESQKEQAFLALERTRVQTESYVQRVISEPEFVRDIARERLGVAEPGEIVIRIEGASGLARPAPPAASSAGR